MNLNVSNPTFGQGGIPTEISQIKADFLMLAAAIDAESQNTIAIFNSFVDYVGSEATPRADADAAITIATNATLQACEATRTEVDGQLTTLEAQMTEHTFPEDVSEIIQEAAASEAGMGLPALLSAMLTQSENAYTVLEAKVVTQVALVDGYYARALALKAYYDAQPPRTT